MKLIVKLSVEMKHLNKFMKIVVNQNYQSKRNYSVKIKYK